MVPSARLIMKTSRSKTIAAPSIGACVQGWVQCFVIDSKTKKVVKEYPKQRNLILNAGLDRWFTTTGWAGIFTHAVAGTGTTPTMDDSGVTTADQSGTTVTLSGGAFVFTDTATDAGKMIKWDTNEEAMIVTVTSPTVAEVNISQTVAADEFTVFRTNQLGLTTEVKRTSTYVSGACGTDQLQPHEWEMYRTYDFTTEAGSVTYNEVGLSNSATVAANLNVRVLLNTPVSLLVDQQFRIVYRMRVTYSPATPRAKTADVPGWPVAPAVTTDGDEAWELLTTTTVDSNGNGSGAGNWDFTGWASGSLQLALMSANTALLAVPTTDSTGMTNLNATTIYSMGGLLAETYVPGSFTGVRYNIITPANGNSTTVRSIGITTQPTNPTFRRYSYFRFLFDEDQTKENTHRFTIRFQWTATRVLI